MTTIKPLRPLPKPPSMHLTVQQTIRDYIIDNNLRAGDSLPSENQLSQQLGVSRNLVREAVRGLEALGVVDIRRGSGLYVNQFSFDPLLDNLHYGLMVDWQELQEMMEIRQALEISLITKAMSQMTPKHKAYLQQALIVMNQAQTDNTAFIDADRQFHRALFASLENKTLLKVLDAFWLSFNNTANQYQETLRGDPALTYAHHKDIVEAVLAEDALAAQEALDQHYTASKTRLKILQKNKEQ